MKSKSFLFILSAFATATIAPAELRFVLTREEKRVIIFIVVAFALGLSAKHYRGVHSPTPDKIGNKHSYSRAQRASPSSTPSRKNARISSSKKNAESTALPNMNRVLTNER
jgi:hypothetical protein